MAVMAVSLINVPPPLPPPHFIGIQLIKRVICIHTLGKPPEKSLRYLSTVSTPSSRVTKN